MPQTLAMRTPLQHPRHDDQILREAAQRDIALGRRISALRDDSHTGTIIKRWVNGAVIPVAERLRGVAEAYLAGDTSTVCTLLDSPLFGLAEMTGDGHRDLRPLMEWLLKGGSPGRKRKVGETTYAEDLVLAAMGVTLERLVRGSSREGEDEWDSRAPLAQIVDLVANAIRETCIGQFLTQVQGAEAMAKVRSVGGKSSWSQRAKLDQVAHLMGGQIRGSLEAEQRGEIDLESVGTRKVLKVMQPDREGVLKERRISLRPPTSGDFDLLRMASRTKGERDTHRQVWASLAVMILCAAQIEGGWFDLVGKAPIARKRLKHHRPTKCLVLSEAAQGAIEGDIRRWIEAAGLTMEPMVCPPEGGDYLTVKHRGVTGRGGPMGLRTDARGSAAWEVACEVLAGTAWSVPEGLLRAIREDERVAALVAKGEEDEGRRSLILAGYRKVAAEGEFWLPIQMDFRGRVYPKTTWVTYQGTDLQKALMCWPRQDGPLPMDWASTMALHMGALYGHGLDKAPLSERLRWFGEVMGVSDSYEVAKNAEEPLALMAAHMLVMAGQGDRVAIQIDGTCNGLQHLSALMGDESAARWVNLCSTTYEDTPRDLYLRVAASVSGRLPRQESDTEVLEPRPEWQVRLDNAGVLVNRKLCKKPVMVLPYGGTRMTIQEAVTSAVLDQLGKEPDPKEDPAGFDAYGGTWKQHPDYEVFLTQRRPLRDHPLFAADCRALGGIVYDAIREVIPRAMAAMDAFRAIAKGVGERSLEWATGPADTDALWVVHAYAQSAVSRTALKGFHLPNSVRSLSMRVGKDDIDKRKHVTGIVANLIHSLDGAHLARTMKRFQELGGTSFGSIHDCLLGRPSEMHLLGRAVREAFAEMYASDPLSWPVRMRDPKAGTVAEFPSWYALAESMVIAEDMTIEDPKERRKAPRVPVRFPERGTWRPEEVLDSAWFFS